MGCDSWGDALCEDEHGEPCPDGDSNVVASKKSALDSPPEKASQADSALVQNEAGASVAVSRPAALKPAVSKKVSKEKTRNPVAKADKPAAKS